MPNRGDRRHKGSDRPPSKGPRKRLAAQGGPGKPFPPGKNSHTGVVFQRGPDRIPRGTIESLYRLVQNDDGSLAREFTELDSKVVLPFRSAIARALILAANGPVAQALDAAEIIANRLEGRPVQKVVAEGSHLTIFYKAGDPAPTWLKAMPPPGKSAA